MNDYDGYLNVGQLIEDGRIDKRRLIAAGDSGELPIAVWADGFFITEYPVKNPVRYRLSPGEWLWLRTAYLRNFEGRKEIRMGKFRSGPNAKVDRWAYVGNPLKKPRITLGDMFIHKDLMRLLSPTAEAVMYTLPPSPVFYPVADGKRWAVGTEGHEKIIRKVRGYQDIAKALRSPRENVLKHILGVDNNAYISTHSSDPEMDERAMSEVRQEISDLEESIKMALGEGLYDEAEEYETDLKRLRQFTKGSFITKTKSKRLDKGDSMKKLTSSIRTRRNTAIKNLQKEGAVDIANHLNEYYKVGDRDVSYSPAGAIPNWILDPPTGKTA